MSTFTTESRIRERFQLSDTTLVPPNLIAAAIDDAHTDLLRYLDPVHETPSLPDALILGETLLAGAYLFRGIAARDAFEQKRIALGVHRIDSGPRFDALMALADATQAKAWNILEPFLKARPSQVLAAVTETVPVLGEE